MEASVSARLVVILCTERSGSTLLSQVLGANARVLAPPEMHLLRYERFAQWRAGYPDAFDSLVWLMERLGLPAAEAELDARFGAMATDAVYRVLLGEAGAERLVVDKTPAYARSVEVLARVESLAPLYVWLTRHPLGVTASHLERRDALLARNRAARGALRTAWERLRNLSRDLRKVGLRRNLRYWCDVNRNIEAHLAALPAQRWTQVRYEDLVREPDAVCARLCAFMGVEAQAAMTDPWARGEPRLRWRIGDEKFLQYRSIDARAAERWRERFSERDLDARTRAAMAAFGYPDR